VSILGNTLMGSSLSVGSSENVDIWGKSQSSSLDVNWYVHIYILSYIWISHTHTPFNLWISSTGNTIFI
jgi:ubiquinone biosynthesis protein COQ9